jgi:MerR family transcriptional regulator, light-induced transcriptional regulator
VHVDEATGTLRIGELSRRTGVTPELLRAWEQRYGLLHPSRSAGGFRLYSDHDERRVRRTKELIAGGWSAAQAAREALSVADRPTPAAPAPAADDEAMPLLDELLGRLTARLDALDGESANAVIDMALTNFSVDTLMRDVLLPYLRDLGDRWASGHVSVAQEHFASNLIRGRLLGLGREWGGGSGPSVVLACPPGEAHELGLIMFGIVLARRGWRITFLGADTPFESLEDTIRRLRPELVVLGVSSGDRIRTHADAIRRLVALVPVALGGHVTAAEAADVGASLLEGDPIEAARLVVAPGGSGLS